MFAGLAGADFRRCGVDDGLSGSSLVTQGVATEIRRVGSFVGTLLVRSCETKLLIV